MMFLSRRLGHRADRHGALPLHGAEPVLNPHQEDQSALENTTFVFYIYIVLCESVER